MGKCTAAIDTIYWRSNEESIQGLSERSYNLNIRDNGWNSVSAAIPIRSSSPSCRSSLLSLAGPSSLQGSRRAPCDPGDHQLAVIKLPDQCSQDQEVKKSLGTLIRI